MYYTVFQGTDGYWYWNLRSANHEIIANGEGYVHKQSAYNAIALVKQSQNAPVYER